MSDSDLIKQFIDSGDETAFEMLVSRHRRFIRRIIFGVFGGWPDEAEETEQEVLIALAGGVKNFSHAAEFTTYLYRLTRNKGIDHLRSLAKRRKHLVYFVPDIPGPWSPEQGSMEAEDRHFLYKVLNKMKEEDRSLILLKEIEGYSLKDVAELMGIPEGTVKSRLHRARNTMIKTGRRMLGKDGEVNEMQRMEKDTKRA
ncbi:RNA polymerase sigma factor [Marispirochaeta aestuarii]|uniref:RNA polymerase sigma factor n=1 Tax=Marispirochaeta aestuarii TaxID=1963862 RepID=UPI002ABE6FB1|nr:RNA polymerase sigma factor [Marispirochaeta aestuarii]